MELLPQPATRIAGVQAFALVGRKDYVAGAGLAPAAPNRRTRARGRALADIGDLHVCAYPPQAQTCLVKITAEDGTVGWGEGHAALGPPATVAVVEDVLAPLLIGGDPLAPGRRAGGCPRRLHPRQRAARRLQAANTGGLLARGPAAARGRTAPASRSPSTNQR